MKNPIKFRDDWAWLIPVLFVALVITGGIVGAVAYHQERTATGCYVSDKDWATDRDGNSKYRVFTSCGVFEIEDSLPKMQFDSADKYEAIKVDHNYDITYIGWRNRPLSIFPNIVDAKEA